MGGGGGDIFGTVLGNVGNRNYKKSSTQAILNVLDPAGSLGNVLAMGGGDKGMDEMGGYEVGGEPSGDEYPKTPAPIETPVDETAAATARAAARRKKKQQSSSQTIYTSSLGVTDQADISRKTLLGQ